MAAAKLYRLQGRLPAPLELPGALGVALAEVEDEEPQGDEDYAHDQERPDALPEPREASPLEKGRPCPLERVGHGGDRGDGLHPTGEHVHLVVDAGDEQQHGRDYVADLLALLGGEQRQHGGDYAEADERDAAHREYQEGAPVVRVREVEVEEQVADAKGDHRLQDAVDDRVEAHPEEVGHAARGAHESVLDSPLPPLPAHRLGEHVEEHREVVPEEGANEQVSHEEPGVHGSAHGLDARADVGDRHGVHRDVDEPDDLPHQVALGQEVIALYVAPYRDQLGEPYGFGQVVHQSSPSADASST